jgi:hypothetical protein
LDLFEVALARAPRLMVTVKCCSLDRTGSALPIKAIKNEMSYISKTLQTPNNSRLGCLVKARDSVGNKANAIFHYTLRHAGKVTESKPVVQSFSDYVISKKLAEKQQLQVKAVDTQNCNRFLNLLDEVGDEMAVSECECPRCMFDITPPHDSNMGSVLDEGHYECVQEQFYRAVNVFKVLERLPKISPAPQLRASMACCSHKSAADYDFVVKSLERTYATTESDMTNMEWEVLSNKVVKESSSKVVDKVDWEDFTVPERKTVNKIIKGKKTFKVYSRLLYHLRTKYFLKYRDHHFMNTLVNEARIWMVKNEFKCDSALDYTIMTSAVLAAFLVSKEELEFRQAVKDTTNFDNMTHLNATVIGDLGKSDNIPKEHSWLGDRLPNMKLKSKTLDF